MRAVLDACVLYPTVMRSVLLGAAEQGLFKPLWSDRILGEWLRAAKRSGVEFSTQAGVEIALIQSKWQNATVESDPLDETLYLPDPNDVHVLQAAINGRADAIVTANIKDFPTRQLARHDILRRDPDGLLLEFAHSHPEEMNRVVSNVHKTAELHSGEEIKVRALLKRTRLPRLGKYYDGKL